ncbi:hypothetical protein [Rhodanobacter sp. BL-MT-08]
MTGPVDPDLANTPPEVSHSPTGMHHPLHGELNSEETAYQDELQHDSALRDSVLRTPR